MFYRFLKPIIFFSFIFVVLFSPVLWGGGLVSAAESGLVPCGGPDQPQCRFCDLAVLGDNVVDFIALDLAVPVSVLLFAYAGILYLVYGMNEGYLQRARAVFLYTAVGLALSLSSWIVITTILNTIATGEFRIAPHARFECTSGELLSTP